MNFYLLLAGVYGFSGAIYRVIAGLILHIEIANDASYFSGYDGTAEPHIGLSNLAFDTISFTLVGTGFLFGILAAFEAVPANAYSSFALSVIEILIVYIFGFDIYISVAPYTVRTKTGKAIYALAGLGIYFFLLFSLKGIVLPYLLSWSELLIFGSIFVIAIVFYKSFEKLNETSRKHLS